MDLCDDNKRDARIHEFTLTVFPRFEVDGFDDSSCIGDEKSSLTYRCRLGFCFMLSLLLMMMIVM